MLRTSGKILGGTGQVHPPGLHMRATCESPRGRNGEQSSLPCASFGEGVVEIGHRKMTRRCPRVNKAQETLFQHPETALRLHGELAEGCPERNQQDNT